MSTLAIWSCSKSNNGKPKISIASITSEIPKGGNLTVDLKFSSSNKLDTLKVNRIRINQDPPQNVPGGDSLHISIPDYSAQKGELEFVQPYDGYLTFGDNENDTLIFQFIVVDVNKISSDTVTSPKVVVHNQ
jgi:hypothetical protein